MTPEHAIARLGKATASRISEAVARTKNGWGASRDTYRNELVWERLNGVPADHFVSQDMQRGIDLEPKARKAYEIVMGVDVELVEFIDHPTLPMAGASPDGLVGQDGLIEIKCPKMSTHIETLIGEKIDQRYFLQMQWQMACTGRQWCDFVSFDDRMKLASMQLHVARVPRDQRAIDDLTREVQLFLHEVDQRVAALIEKYGGDVRDAA